MLWAHNSPNFRRRATQTEANNVPTNGAVSAFLWALFGSTLAKERTSRLRVETAMPACGTFLQSERRERPRHRLDQLKVRNLRQHAHAAEAGGHRASTSH